MYSYRAVFCDIDGTLLTSDHRITDAAKEKIRKLHASGIPFILVSARMPAGIYPVQEELGIQAPIISYGGALILDADRRPMSSTGIPMTLAARIRRYLPADTEDYCFCTYSYDKWIVADSEHPLIRREEKITSVSSISGPVEKLLAPDAPVHKLLGFGTPAVLDATAAQLKSTFPQCAVYKSAPNILEIMDNQVSKSRAVHILCEKMGISPQNTVAFGDNYNDVDMLLAAGLGIAMGNAPDEVKKQADEITADNDHEGLLLSLNRLFPDRLEKG